MPSGLGWMVRMNKRGEREHNVNVANRAKEAKEKKNAIHQAKLDSITNNSRQSPTDIITTFQRQPFTSSSMLQIGFLNNPIYVERSDIHLGGEITKTSAGTSVVPNLNCHYDAVSPPAQQGVTPPPKPSTTFNGGVYELVQFHFHKTSEHTLDGNYHAMEVHFVHKMTNADGDTQYLVLGFFLRDTPNDAGPFDHIVNWDNNVTDYSVTIRSSDIPNHYYTYPGSLTTPDFTASVRWIIFSTPLNCKYIDNWKVIKNTPLGKPMRAPQRTLESEVQRVDTN